MSSLTGSTAETLLMERLKDCVGAYKVAWPNVKFTPIVGTAYYRTSFIYPAGERLTHDNAGRFRGIFQVDAVVPAGKGNATVLSMARTVAAYFDNQKLTGSGVSVEIIKTPALGPGLQEVDWYFIPVSIYYSVLN